MNTRLKLLLGAGALLAAVVAHADSSVVLNFAGLNGNAQESPDNYYNGGTGSLGSTGGTNYGISFGANALACSGAPGGSCNTAQIPGGAGANTLFFTSGPGDIMNRAAGFTGGFSFDYAADVYPGVVQVYSGLNGTGTLLASINLGVTPNGANIPGCLGTNYCPFVAAGVTFSGVAESVNFTGTANYIGFADITLGSATPGGAGTPTAAPELDAATSAGGMTLLFGALAVLLGRRKPLPQMAS